MKKTIKRSGFTIVELVIVIAVIAVLAGVLIPTFGGIIERANYSNDNQIVANINKVLVVEDIITGREPNDVVEIQKYIKENGLSLKTKSEDNYIWYNIEKNQVFLAKLDLSGTNPALVTSEETIPVEFNADLTAPEAFIKGYLFLSEEADGDLAKCIWTLRNPNSAKDLSDSLKAISELENGSTLYANLNALMNRTAVMTKTNTYYVGEAKDEATVTRIIVSSVMDVVEESSVSGIKTRFPNVIVVDFHSGVKDIKPEAVGIIDTAGAELYYVYNNDEIYAIDHANGGNIEYLITKDERGQKIATVSLIYVDKTGKQIGTGEIKATEFLANKYTFTYNFPYLADHTNKKDNVETFYAFNYYSLHKNDDEYTFAADVEKTYTLSEDEKILIDGGNNLVFYAVFEETNKDFLVGTTYYSSKYMTYLLSKQDDDKFKFSNGTNIIVNSTGAFLGDTSENAQPIALTIPSGVSLWVPHGKTTYSRDANTGRYKPYFSSSEKKAYDSTFNKDDHEGVKQLTIAHNVTLTNNGYITVDAQMYEDNVNTHYGFISENSSVLIVDGSIINCCRFEAYGIVRRTNTTGNIVSKPNSTSVEIMTILDLHGGNNTLGSIQQKISPFNHYSVDNIRLPLTIEAGSVYSTFGFISAASQTKDMEFKIAGVASDPNNLRTDNPLFHMHPNSKIVKSYDNEEGIQLKMYGTIEDAKMKLPISLTGLGSIIDGIIEWIGGLEFSFTNIPMPFPDFDVSIEKDATVTLSKAKAYKILPGSDIEIKEGGTLNVGCNVIIYDSFVLDGNGKTLITPRVYRTFDEEGNEIVPFTSNKATLKVCGTLVLQNGAKFAGFVDGGAKNAIIKVESGAKTSCDQIYEGGNGELSLRGKIDKYIVVNERGLLWKGRWQTAVDNKDEQISETPGTYYYNNFKWSTTKAQ